MMLAGVASAAVQQGQTEVDAMFSYQKLNGPEDGGDITSWSFMGGLGYFFTDNIRVGASGMYSNADYESFMSATELTRWGIGANVKYHFMPTNQLVPYVGGQILWESWDLTQGVTFVGVDPDTGDVLGEETVEESGDTDGFSFGPVAGVRYELNEKVDLFAEFQYNWYTGDISDDLADDSFAIFAGLIYQFN
jgi:opacity protein-like surface antigen